MKRNCEDCVHHYYEDLYYELCCDINKKYIGEMHAEEKAKDCKNYERICIKRRNQKG